MKPKGFIEFLNGTLDELIEALEEIENEEDEEDKEDDDEVEQDEEKNDLLKVFISQPMKDKTNEEIEAARKRVCKELDKRFGKGNYVILDSFFKDAPHNAKPLWYLGKSLQLLAEADIAYFVTGFTHARGCTIERSCATQYEIPIIIEECEYDDKIYIQEYRI